VITRDVDLTTWAKTEIAALRMLFAQDSAFAPASEKQVQALGSLMGQGFSDHRKTVRIQALREITGLEALTSSKQLTSHTISVLIDYLKLDIEEDWRLSEQGKRLLSAVELWVIEVVGVKKPKAKRKQEEEFDEDGWPIVKPKRHRIIRKDNKPDPASGILDNNLGVVALEATPW
jgi:head-tail adaptor